MKIRPSKITVHRDFKIFLKKKAADNDISMFELTKKLGEQHKYEKQKKPKFDFTF